MKFPVIEFPLSSFGVREIGEKNIKQIFADVSDIENRHLQYLDTYNRGFIVDFGNGRKVTFALTATETDAEGDIMLWQYRSNEGMTATVFND